LESGWKARLLAQIHDHDAAIGIIMLAIVITLGLRRRAVGVYGQLYPGPVTLDSPTFLFFSSPNLVDDEGRKHGAASVSRAGQTQ
jgi:hypothetical protein